MGEKQRVVLLNLRALIDELTIENVNVVKANEALVAVEKSLKELNIIEDNVKADRDNVSANAIEVNTNKGIVEAQSEEVRKNVEAAMLYLAASNVRYDEFDDRYLGSFGVPPHVDNDGMPIQEGAIYWNLVEKKIYIYDSEGLRWIPLLSADGSLKLEHNLADLPDKEAARENLDVYSKEEVVARTKGGYQGEYAEDPIVSKSGEPLEETSIYYNIPSKEFRVFGTTDGGKGTVDVTVVSDSGINFTIEAITGDNFFSSRDVIMFGNNIPVKGSIEGVEGFNGSFTVSIGALSVTTDVDLSMEFDTLVNGILPVGVYDVTVRAQGFTAAGDYDETVVFVDQLIVADLQADVSDNWVSIYPVGRNIGILMHPNKLTEDVVIPPNFNAIIYGDLDLNGFSIISDGSSNILRLDDSNEVNFRGILGDPSDNVKLLEWMTSVTTSIDENKKAIEAIQAAIA